MESFRLLRVQMLVLWLCMLGSSSLLAETRHLHVIKLFDNENHDYVIREGCRSIGFGIDQEVAMLANHLGILNVIEYNLSGADFNLERLDQVLNYEMAYQERDIIVLVYIGHGFRDASTTSTFPNLYFKSYTESVNFSEIREQILEMNPSLLMNIVLACNVTISDYSEPPPFRSDNQPPEVVTLPKSGRHHGIYQGLFADEPSMTKVIDLISADREYFTFLSLDGGIFFNEILYTFQEAMGGYPYHGWQEICATIARRTEERSQRKGMQQKPVCQYNVRLSPVVLPAPRTASLFEPSPCQMAARDLRKMQRDQLRQLRRQHRQNMREARRSGAARTDRRLISQEQRVEYESQKLRHEKEYQRRLLQCR